MMCFILSPVFVSFSASAMLSFAFSVSASFSFLSMSHSLSVSLSCSLCLCPPVTRFLIEFEAVAYSGSTYRPMKSAQRLARFLHAHNLTNCRICTRIRLSQNYRNRISLSVSLNFKQSYTRTYSIILA